MIEYDTQSPVPILLPALEVGDTLYDANCGFRQWLGTGDDLTEVERVFDDTKLDVQMTNLTTSSFTFSVTAVGAVPDNQDSYQVPFQLRAVTTSGLRLPAVQYIAQVIPSFGAKAP